MFISTLKKRGRVTIYNYILVEIETILIIINTYTNTLLILFKRFLPLLRVRILGLSYFCGRSFSFLSIVIYINKDRMYLMNAIVCVYKEYDFIMFSI